MAGMRSNFEKWEPNVAARLISMSLCVWRLQESQVRRHRAKAKTAKSVALNPRNDGFLAVMGQLDGWEAVVPCHSICFAISLSYRMYSPGFKCAFSGLRRM